MEPPLLSMVTPQEMAERLAERARTLRLVQGWTRATLARRAGVSASSLKRFETTGKGSLELVLRVAHALGRLDELDGLLQPLRVRSMAELEQQAELLVPKRGRR